MTAGFLIRPRRRLRRTTRSANRKKDGEGSYNKYKKSKILVTNQKGPGKRLASCVRPYGSAKI